MRVYFIGPQSVGKTTLAKYVSNKYDLELLTEVVREIIEQYDKSLDEIRLDIDEVNEFQKEVFEKQIERERGKHDFVSDRAFDNIAYACYYGTIAHLIDGDKLAHYMDKLAHSLVFYVKPHKQLLDDDGVRGSIDWCDVCRIDGMIKMMLELYNIDYITISTKEHQERVKTIDTVLKYYEKSI